MAITLNNLKPLTITTSKPSVVPDNSSLLTTPTSAGATVSNYGPLGVTEAMISATGRGVKEVTSDPMLTLRVAMEHLYKSFSDLPISDQTERTKFAFVSYLFGPELVEKVRSLAISDQRYSNLNPDKFSDMIPLMLNEIQTNVAYSAHGTVSARATNAANFFNGLESNLV